MRFSVLALGLASIAQGALLQARVTGCTVSLEPTQDPPSAPGENIVFGSLNRWSNATGGKGANGEWVDYSSSTKAPFSFTYKANTIPDYETTSEIQAVLQDGWVGTYLSGQSTPKPNDFLITAVSCK